MSVYFPGKNKPIIAAFMRKKRAFRYRLYVKLYSLPPNRLFLSSLLIFSIVIILKLARPFYPLIAYPLRIFLGILLLLTSLFFDLILAVSERLLYKREKSKTARNLNKAPGTNLLRIVDFLYSPKTVEQTFKPIVADWRLEYFEALHEKRLLKARWISFRYYFSFVHVMGLSKVWSVIKDIISTVK